MKKKQIISLVVACAVFIVTGISSVMVNSSVNDVATEMDALFNMTSGAYQIPTENFLAVIDIYGTIQATPETQTDIFSTATIAYDHGYYMELVDILMDTPNCKGIILDVDSPGGTVYESDEFYLKLMDYKEYTGNPIYAYFRSYACSGAYYIAMAADEIYANRNCTTGSIGVIISTYNMAGLFDKIGIEEIAITSGENKAMGSVGGEFTDEQRAIYQSIVDESYNQFVEIVCLGRDMDVSTVKMLADGRIYTATQAYDRGLIDGVCSSEEFYYNMSEIATCYDLSNSGVNNIWSMLGVAISGVTKKSDSQVTLEWINTLGSGVPMYVYYGQ